MRKTKIRVLHVVDSLSKKSGVSSFVMNLYKNIDRELISFDFMICVKYSQSYEDEVMRLGGNVVFINNPLSLKTMTIANRNAKEFFDRNAKKYDIVHLHSASLCEFTVRHAYNNGIFNIIIHSHSSMFSCNPIKKFLHRILILRLKKYAKHYWMCSNEAGQFLYGKNFCKHNKTELIYNAVETEKFSFCIEKRNELRNLMGLESKIIVLHISNYSPLKNHTFLVDVIKKTNDRIAYVFIGEGPAKKQFKIRIYKEGLDSKCVFIGQVSNVNDYLQMADLVVLPSIREGLPVTIVEAQAAGVPCLISNTITKDVCVERVDYLSLNQMQWIKYINSFTALDNEEREKASFSLKNSVFNIEKEANRVSFLYYKMLQTNK